MLSKKTSTEKMKPGDKGHTSTYSSRFFSQPIPKYEIPEGSMPANAAYQLIHDELNMDANPALNLASFVTTWMEPEATQLMQENVHKNFIDHDEYPQTEVIHHRCVNMMARLFNIPEECKAIGSATIGSSEAIMLCLLGHKWNWKKHRQKDKNAVPNIVFGAEVHVCWEKFARYFDVEMRIIPLEKGLYTITAEKVAERIDENTICVGAILGTTYTGQADPIEEINELLIKIKKEKGWDIPLHIDAASGGFVVPFTEPDYKWDFRLEQVKSINVSGHKYGLVYPGIGWMLWKEESEFPEELIFKVNYLGGWMPTFTLNFSCNSANVIAQYYNFLRLGKAGYRSIMENCLKNAQYLAELFEGSGKFEMINKSQKLPIIAMRLKEGITQYTVFDLSSKLRERGWVMSAYTMPENAQDVAVMRVVVKENFSHDMADILYNDTMAACAALEKQAAPPPPVTDGERHHPIC
ncbi:MAG: Glutamate decarboxylase [Chlamydiae bacterium]|nr:Glutamate decarboxylase [Chlamydiota bacterium]